MIMKAAVVTDKERCALVRRLLCKQAMEHPLGAPFYYGVCYYGKSFSGETLDSHLYRKRWDRNEVIKTHAFINKMVRKCFGNIPIWWSIERHRDFIDEDGNNKMGSFHSNGYFGHIPDSAIEDPSPHLMPLFYKEDDVGIPINMRPVNKENLKLLLLNACIRQAKWVGRHPAALNLSVVPPDEMEQHCFKYGFKDIKDNMDALTYVIDWDNSSFYKQA